MSASRAASLMSVIAAALYDARDVGAPELPSLRHRIGKLVFLIDFGDALQILGDVVQALVADEHGHAERGQPGRKRAPEIVEPPLRQRCKLVEFVISFRKPTARRATVPREHVLAMDGIAIGISADHDARHRSEQRQRRRRECDRERLLFGFGFDAERQSGSVSDICLSGEASNAFSIAASRFTSSSSFAGFSLSRVLVSSTVSDGSSPAAVWRSAVSSWLM